MLRALSSGFRNSRSDPIRPTPKAATSVHRRQIESGTQIMDLAAALRLSEVRARCGGDLASRTSERQSLALLGRLARGDLLDQIDDAAPELGVGYLGEGASQRKSFRRGKKVRHIGRRAAVTVTFRRRRAAR